MIELAACYIGIGSNLGESMALVKGAVRSISQLPQTRLVTESSWYQSEPVGPQGQPDFINGAVLIETGLEPLFLLDSLQQIENAAGRERAVRWGPRTLDLDILLYDEVSLTSDRLTIPHPELCRRSFVILPLLDIDENLQLPDGTRLLELSSQLDCSNCRRL